MVVEPRIIHAKDVELAHPPGGAVARRLIHPKTKCSEVFQAGLLDAEPGQIVHRWHVHKGTDRGPGFEVTYPENFEEAYIITHGKGTLQWRVDGQEKSRIVTEGDAIFFTRGMGKNQLVNTGKEKLTLVFIGSPPVTAKR